VDFSVRLGEQLISRLDEVVYEVQVVVDLGDE
jgi:hypothetical protein